MHILIIEDELLAFKRIKKMLSEIITKPFTVSHLDSIASSIEWFEQNRKTDLVFMDIEISDGNSFEIFKHTTIDAPIVFTTAYNQFAMDAFKVNSVDYLLKPIKKDSLALTLLKFEKYHSKTITTLTNTFSSPFKNQIIVKLGQKIIPISTDEIAYIFSKEKMTYYCNIKGQLFPSYTSLDTIQEDLNPATFFRLNRQFITHKNAIVEIKTIEKSKIQIKLNPPVKDEIIISTEKSAQFKKWLNS